MKGDLAKAVETLLNDPSAVEEVARVQESPLTMEDVLDRVPWCRNTVREMVQRRQIPMVKVQGRWIISRKDFRRAVQRNFEAPRGARTLD